MDSFIDDDTEESISEGSSNESFENSDKEDATPPSGGANRPSTSTRATRASRRRGWGFVLIYLLFYLYLSQFNYKETK